jgi:hypothetical protein
MSLPSVKAAYFHGVADPSKTEPKSYTLDTAILTRLWNAELQIDLKLRLQTQHRAVPAL